MKTKNLNIKIIDNNKGLTLVETMITMSILMIFMTYLYGIYFTEIKEYSDISSKVYTSKNAKEAMNVILNEIKNVVQIDSDTMNNNLTFTENAGTITRIEASDVLVYDSGSFVVEETVIPIDLTVNTNANIYFDSNNNTLYYKDGTLLSDNIDTVLIENDATNKMVYITITVIINGRYDNYSIKSGISIAK